MLKKAKRSIITIIIGIESVFMRCSMRREIKSLKAIIIAAMLILSVCIFIGCGGGSAPAEDAGDVSEESSNETFEDVLSLKDENVSKLAQEFFDVNDRDYIGLAKDSDSHRNDNPFKSITIDGEPITVGASYDEILSQGWKPTDDTYADEEMGSMIPVCTFRNAEGKSIIFGFHSDGDAKKVKDGSLMYWAVYDDTENPAEFLVDGVGKGSAVEDVVNAFGNKPRVLRQMSYSIGECLHLEYEVKDKAERVELSIDPASRKVISIILQKVE